VTDHAAPKPDHEKAPFGEIERRLIPWLHGFDGVIYVLIGVVFLLAAMGMLVYSVVSFEGNDRAVGFPLAIVNLINDLLLVMIILEVLRTVLSYLDQRGSSLQPFLFIGIISATRRILAIGAQMTVAGETLSPEAFQRSMIDLGANAAAILAISIALYLIRRHGMGGE
jgi:uncharacterized membrane protein (DUF373 family)